MANKCNGKRIVLDTFTSEIKLSNFTELNTSGFKKSINSIEWQKPVTIGDTCDIYELEGATQVPLFNQECVISKESLIKYYHGLDVEDLIINAAGVKSGVIIIILNK
jgi:hypothetical protein